MKTALAGFAYFKKLFKMFEKAEKSSEKVETIQEIANKLVEEQLRTQHVENGPKERTIFILGSKAVGKSTVINKFFDREEPTRPTLALEYAYGRRTSGSQKQVLNIWELGALDNAEQLVAVPMLTHGIEHFAAIIMLDLSEPQRVWLELERVYKSLRDTSRKMLNKEQQQAYQERAVERIKKEHVDVGTLELMPFPVVIVGGKYDLFMDFDPELKKHICRCLRSMAHLIGACLLFYSSKIPKQSKTLRDTISHLGFGSPTNPFRVHTTDYNDALSIWFGKDSWERIGNAGALSVERIGTMLNVEVPQLKSGGVSQQAQNAIVDPAKDAGFRESIIDEMRAQKDEELAGIIRESQLRGQFESVAG